MRKFLAQMIVPVVAAAICGIVAGIIAPERDVSMIAVVVCVVFTLTSWAICLFQSYQNGKHQEKMVAAKEQYEKLYKGEKPALDILHPALIYRAGIQGTPVCQDNAIRVVFEISNLHPLDREAGNLFAERVMVDDKPVRVSSFNWESPQRAGMPIKKANAVLEIALPKGASIMRTHGMDFVRVSISGVFMEFSSGGKYELGNFFTCVRVW